ncbi:Electron transfer flavoprotein small subunit [Sedimentisphaera cyanobacteriorum]|uniref:Electron transfer flavoprotein small subunit n=1 Tax=Sedimentisphaera cyanobacteriorum TaxID=1940790 RepID=A0A1Q2HSA7_9BACT|nr:electron transfer flavoprotein subunit beta/FixA family protein [Sedimentisphaera cyanobacteriorum]AQQ10154.1 Electron transfer flavoprotein small subunit [Sedimentisphaera cyanobacteriorum]
MAYKCIVLIKQVPDTSRITGEAMNEDGTVNRGALPAIFNPEDLNALELALEIKEKYGGSVTAVTMGLPSASEVLREALFMGADDAVLVTDRRCAASDTLATSYILTRAAEKIGCDLVLCGRQAIDGDTAQVGPQMAEKLDMPQITYVEEVHELTPSRIVCRRNMGNGWQRTACKLPVLLTVTDQANEPRIGAARRIMKYKNAKTPAEISKEGGSDEDIREMKNKGLLIGQLNLDDVQADLQWCGRDGSPTKVHRIMSVVLTAKESKEVDSSAQGINDMVHELIEDHTIG